MSDTITTQKPEGLTVVEWLKEPSDQRPAGNELKLEAGTWPGVLAGIGAGFALGFALFFGDIIGTYLVLAAVVMLSAALFVVDFASTLREESDEVKNHRLLRCICCAGLGAVLGAIAPLTILGVLALL